MIPAALMPFKAYAKLAMWAAIVIALLVSHAWAWRQGALGERSEWTEQQNEDLRAANARIKELVASLAKKEKDHAQALSDISAAHLKEKEDAKAQRDLDIAAAIAGDRKLRFNQPIQRDRNRRTTAEASPSPGGRDGSATGDVRSAPGGDLPAPVELPGEISARLYALAHDADEIARQLASCQRVVLEDRRHINGEER